LGQGITLIHAVSTKDQIADLPTKPLAENKFIKLREKIMGTEKYVKGAYLQGSERKHGVVRPWEPMRNRVH